LLPNSRIAAIRREVATMDACGAASSISIRFQDRKPERKAVQTGEEQAYLLWRCLDFVELAEELLPSIFRTVK
jgi:hypothetical protein